MTECNVNDSFSNGPGGVIYVAAAVNQWLISDCVFMNNGVIPPDNGGYKALQSNALQTNMAGGVLYFNQDATNILIARSTFRTRRLANA